MAKKTTHPLSYRVWNQTRLAHHVDSMFQIYEGLTDPLARTGRAWLPRVDEPIGRMRNATYQSIIVHLDMIKAKQGVSLYGLIGETQADAKFDAPTGDALRAKIDTHAIILRNVSRQRNNLVAHRSPTQTFREIRDAYPVQLGDLASLVATYYEVAAELYAYVPFQNIWQRRSEKAGLDALLAALTVPVGDAT